MTESTIQVLGLLDITCAQAMNEEASLENGEGHASHGQLGEFLLKMTLCPRSCLPAKSVKIMFAGLVVGHDRALNGWKGRRTM